MALIDEPEPAIRLARAIASDIALYNEAKIAQGLMQDNLFDTLEGELNEGLNLYKSRVSKRIFESTNFYYRAIIDVVLRNKGTIKSNIW